MGWSSGIDMMAWSSGEMNLVHAIAGKENDMKYRDIDPEMFKPLSFSNRQRGKGKLLQQIMNQRWLCSTP